MANRRSRRPKRSLAGQRRPIELTDLSTIVDPDNRPADRNTDNCLSISLSKALGGFAHITMCDGVGGGYLVGEAALAWA
jgi:hypothetical protein